MPLMIKISLTDWSICSGNVKKPDLTECKTYKTKDKYLEESHLQIMPKLAAQTRGTRGEEELKDN